MGFFPFPFILQSKLVSMITIGNGIIQAGIAIKGAELQSLKHLENGLQYMWKGDPAVWGKFSPILFPIIGTLKDDRFLYKEKEYKLSRHGFAREKDFNLEEVTETRAVFLLTHDSDSTSKYPFEFELRIIYELIGDRLSVTYSVINPSSEPFYFSVGGHPAFALPLAVGTDYQDYYLLFDSTETCPRWPISPEGLIEKNPVGCLENSNRLPITKELFMKDALVFKNLSSKVVSLKSDKTQHGWSFDFSGFPYLGIWAAKGADFICIEPWCGIADSVDHSGELTNKEGIQKAEKGKDFKRTWSLQIW